MKKSSRPQSAVPLLGAKSQVMRPDQRINMSSLFPKRQQIVPQPPKAKFFDQEDLYNQNLSLKQEMNQLKYVNQKLRALNQQLQQKIVSLEKMDTFYSSPYTLRSGQQGETSIVASLKQKVKEQNDEIVGLNENLEQLYKAVKLSSLQELQKEIKVYQDEILNWKQRLQIAQRLSDQDLYNDPNISQRISNFELMVTSLENQIEKLERQLSIANQERQKMAEDLVKLQEDNKKLEFERVKYKTQLEDQVITENERYQMKKSEFVQKKLQDTLQQLDKLKGELSLIESRYKESQKQHNQELKDHKQKLTQYQQRQQWLEESSRKKDQLIQDLQERVQILDLLKQKNSPKAESSPEIKKALQPPLIFHEKECQFPEPKQDERVEEKNTQPIDKERLAQLLIQLKYIVLRKLLTKEKLQYVFGQWRRQFLQLKDAIEVFQRQPFHFKLDDAVILSRYFVGEDCGLSSKMQMEDNQEIQDLIKLIYKECLPEDTEISFQTISNSIQLGLQISERLHQGKFEKEEYNIDDFQTFTLKNKLMTQEQLKYTLLRNDEYSQNPEMINIRFIRLCFKEQNDFYMKEKIKRLTQMTFLIHTSKAPVRPQEYFDPSEITDSLLRLGELSENKMEVKEIIESQNVITSSHFRPSETGLRSSELRKPQSDSLTYSTSKVQTFEKSQRQSWKKQEVNAESQYMATPQKENEDDKLDNPPNLKGSQQRDSPTKKPNSYPSDRKSQAVEESDSIRKAVESRKDQWDDSQEEQFIEEIYEDDQLVMEEL